MIDSTRLRHEGDQAAGRTADWWLSHRRGGSSGLLVLLVVVSAALTVVMVAGPIIGGLAVLVLVPLIARGLFR